MMLVTAPLAGRDENENVYACFFNTVNIHYGSPLPLPVATKARAMLLQRNIRRGLL